MNSSSIALSSVAIIGGKNITSVRGIFPPFCNRILQSLPAITCGFVRRRGSAIGV